MNRRLAILFRLSLLLLVALPTALLAQDVGTEPRLSFSDSEESFLFGNSGEEVESFSIESNYFSAARTLSIYGGWDFPSTDPFGYYSPRTIFDYGGAAGLSVGKRHSPRLRSEIDFTFRRNPADTDYGRFYLYAYDLAIYPFTELEGHMNTYSGMLNFYYDFDRPAGRRLTPYVGAGLGLIYFDTDLSWQGVGETVSNESAFSFNGIGGVTMRLNRRADFFAEYRVLVAAKTEFTIPGHEIDFFPRSAVDTEYQYITNNFFMGLRWTF